MVSASICAFMVVPRKGGGPTERLFIWDFGGGRPLVGFAGPTGEFPPATTGDDDRELVPPGALRRSRLIQSTVERGALRRSPLSFNARCRRLVQCRLMERPLRFEHSRWVGDKRNQVLHDVDNCTAPEVVDELMTTRTYVCFGPDTAAEAGNRNYKRCSECVGARQATDADAGVSDNAI